MEIKLTNKDKIFSKFNSIKNIDLTPVINKAVLLVEGHAKELVKVDTGNLRASIHSKVDKKSKSIIGKVYTNCEYGPYIEFGTGIKGNGTYEYPVKNLSYRDTPWVYTNDNGKTFYYTKGQVAKPYMYPALSLNKEKIQKLADDEIKNIVHKKG